MNPALLLLPILIPACSGLLCFVIPDRAKSLKEWLAVAVAAANLVVAVIAFGQATGSQSLDLNYPWIEAWGISFSLRLYQFSAFILLAAAGFGFLVSLYSLAFMKGKPKLRSYYAFLLLTLAQVNGAVLANNLVLMLVFWESLLLTLYGFIAIGRQGSTKTAVKAFVIAGITDLCMMTGVIILYGQSSTFTMSDIHVQASGLGGFAFVLLLIGAVSKAGSMPFHSWIPDAAVDAPLTFMAFVPAALEKLLGIYFLSRVALDFFAIAPGSWISATMLILGCFTILFAVLMALVQKDYKRLLSYHAISQVGYMILGIGTAVPVGIVGGIFHMINHAMYKSGLFLTAGSVERQAGSTDLAKLGGLSRNMPITFACFIVTAASISGVPPFNGFFSKELVYDGAWQAGWIFYAVALLGSVLTAASFLKLGHAVYLGSRSHENLGVKEAPPSMLIPMLALASLCVIFGVFNFLPIDNLIAPIVAGRGGEIPEGGFTAFPALPFVLATLGALLLAFLNHLYGVRKTGKGLGAVDHIHYAPGLRSVYAAQEKGWLDPYNMGMAIAKGLARLGWWADRAVDWFQETAIVGATRLLSGLVRKSHTGRYSRYIVWSVAGAIGVLLWMTLSL